MAANRVPGLRQAIHDTLQTVTVNGSPGFATGTAFYRRLIGPCPAYMIWWDGFTSRTPERRADMDLAETTHRFLIEIYVPMGSNDEDNNTRLDALTEAAIAALQENYRLNGKCLRSRVTDGQTIMWEGNNKNVFLQTSIFLEADCRQW